MHYINQVHYSDIQGCPLKDENSNGPCHKGFIAGHMTSRPIISDSLLITKVCNNYLLYAKCAIRIYCTLFFNNLIGQIVRALALFLCN